MEYTDKLAHARALMRVLACEHVLGAPARILPLAFNRVTTAIAAQMPDDGFDELQVLAATAARLKSCPEDFCTLKEIKLRLKRRWQLQLTKMKGTA